MDEVRAGKQKRILRLTGITIGVYLTFRYLLPVVIPFLVAGALAFFLKKPYGWLTRRYRLPKSVAATLITAVFVAMISAGLFFLVRELLYQIGDLAENIPEYMEQANLWMRELCEQYERTLRLEDGEIFDWISVQWNSGLAEIGSQIMTAILGNSVALVSWTIKFGAGAVVIFLATILFLMSGERINDTLAHSPFNNEISSLREKLIHAGSAYIKSQLIIMTLTAVICCVGLSLMGNPYSIITGIGIGLLDALPLFGTGTVFIPWVIVELIRRRWLRAVVLAVIYLITYFLREVLETKILGKSMGLSPLASLAAIYVGLKLFGIIGVVLGPFGLIAIQELARFDEKD